MRMRRSWSARVIELVDVLCSIAFDKPRASFRGMGIQDATRSQRGAAICVIRSLSRLKGRQRSDLCRRSL